MKKKYTTIQSVLVVFLSLILAGCYTIGENPASLAQQNNQSEPDERIPVLYVDGLGLPFGGNPKEPPFKDKDDWPELYEMFESNGYELKAASIQTKGHIECLSNQLFTEVNRLFKNKDEFHIVAKSMGGLVTRRMLRKHPELTDRVLSVTTIATPHRGSPIASVLVGGKDRHCGSFQQNIFMSIGKFFDDDIPFQESGEDMQVAEMCKFNQENPYDPHIPFFSMGFNIQCDDFWCKLGNYFPFIVNYPVNSFSGYLHDEIALQNKGKTLEDVMNDGLVPVSSAKWGTYLGTFEGEHIATTENPGVWGNYPLMCLSHIFPFNLFNFIPIVPKQYRYNFIWKDVFERVIVNLNHIKNKSNPEKEEKNCPIPIKNPQPQNCD
jgi:Putative serine esterase (DUF676)